MSDPSKSYDRAKKTVALRPFNKGIVRNVSSTLTPIGAVFDASGFLATTSGLTRRGGLQVLDTIDPPSVTRYDYINSFINDDGSKTTYAIADGKFYELAGSTLIERPCEYKTADDLPNVSSISASAGTTLVTGVLTTFLTQGIQTGDILIVDPSGTPLYYTVDQISSDLSLTVLEQIVAAIPASTEFIIERTLYPAPEWQITVERIDRILYICTGARPLMGYDVDNPDRVHPIDTDRPFIPKTILVFNDRLWCGNIFIPESMATPTPSRWYTNRMSWSQILPEAGYTPTITGVVDIDPLRHFNDLVAIGGEISGLATLGAYLAVFFEFGVHYGRQTQVPGDVLPLGFDVISTGKRGVLQPGALAVSKNGIYFVSTDDVYFLGENLLVETVSDEVQAVLFRSEILNTRYKIENLGETNGIIIGCGYNEDSYDEFWAFNLDNKSWTRFYYACAYFNVFTIGSRLVYSDYPDGQIYGVEPPGQNDDALGNILPQSPVLTTLVPIQPPDDLPQYPLTDYTESNAIYGGESGVQSNDRFYATVGPYITVMDSTNISDQNDAPVTCLIETGDFDFNYPDQNKTLYKIAMRLYNVAEVEITYHVEGSLNSGKEWWDLGDLIIYEGDKEGRVNFKFTGSAPRLRLTSNTLSPAYEIIEVTLDVKSRGKQFSDA